MVAVGNIPFNLAFDVALDELMKYKTDQILMDDILFRMASRFLDHGWTEDDYEELLTSYTSHDHGKFLVTLRVLNRALSA